MKVLILTYYWPPAGGSGVQRWLKFVKYLQEFGITPVVYTVENPDFAIADDQLATEIPEGVEVLKYPIWEPYQLANFFSKKEGKQINAGFLNANKSLGAKISTFVRANFFIPDARMFWIKPSVRYLTNYLKENPVDAIISTGPPHSLHCIAQKLKKNTGVKWISDFRDPWTNIDYFHQLPLLNWAKKRHFKLEQKVLRNSDAVIVVGKNMQQNYVPYNANTRVITNGFDVDENFTHPKLDEKFSITHIGMMNADRNPTLLWESLADLLTKNEALKAALEIKLIGKIDPVVYSTLEANNLSSYVTSIPYVPHHEVHRYQQKSQLLLLAVNDVPSAKGIITGKIFEYLVAKRPILAIGPADGDLAEILYKSKAGIIVGFNDKEKLKNTISTYFDAYSNNDLGVNSQGISQYHRRELTKNLVRLIKETVAQ